MRRILFLLLAVGILVSAAPAAIDLSEVGAGARPLGMGSAYIGLANDASAIFTNPAGLSRSDKLCLISMSGQMLGDVSYLMLGASDMSPIGKVGFGYISASVGSIPLTRLEGSGSSLEAVQYGLTDYSSSVIFFSWGSRLNRFIRKDWADNLSLGASWKYFLQGFSGGGTAMQDANGVGMDADIGLIWDINVWSTMGITLQNFLPVSMGGRFIWTKNQVTESMPLDIRVGGRFKMLGPLGIYQNEDQTLDLMVDYENQYTLQRPAVFHVGCEFWPQEVIALRLGIDQKPKATEAGTGTDSNLTAGVGIFWSGFTFDYAYHQYGELSDNATHFFSIGFRGEEKLTQRALKKAEQKKPTIPLPEVVSQPTLKAFSDVPEGYWAQKPISYLATVGIMDGYPDDTFQPTREVTRGELAEILAKTKGFSTEEAITKYMNGGTFHPEQKINRAEAAVILARFAGLYVKPKLRLNVFPDMPKNHWAAPSVAAAKESGFFAYLSGQGFGPKINITRAEAAEMISKTPFAKEKIDKLISGETK